MSSLKCTCGHIVKDTVYPLPTEGYLLCQEDYDGLVTIMRRDIAQFIDAITQGNRDNWISQYFGNYHPTNLTNAEIIDDIMTRFMRPTMLEVSQCKNCGRLWIQNEPDENSYQPFNPELNWKGLLRGRGVREDTD